VSQIVLSGGVRPATAFTRDLFRMPDGGVAVDALDGGDFAGHAVRADHRAARSAIGLFGWFSARSVAHHLGDGDQVAGVDLGFVFLGSAETTW